MDNILNNIVLDFSKMEAIETIFLSGSQTSNFRDNNSDSDLYIYSNDVVSIKKREEIAKKYSDRYEINNNYWENGDEWICRENGLVIDIMYRSFNWIDTMLDNVVNKHYASVGYTTCFWNNIINSTILYDKNSLGKSLIKKYNLPYPEELKNNIIKKNYPLLKNNISSYYVQIAKAIIRNDYVSINHRIAAFLASYFDIIFAVNGYLHPGEKKLIKIIDRDIDNKPQNIISNIDNILKNSDYSLLLDKIDILMLNLDNWLKENKFI